MSAQFTYSCICHWPKRFSSLIICWIYIGMHATVMVTNTLTDKQTNGMQNITSSKTVVVTCICHSKHNVANVLSCDLTKWKHFLCYWPFVRGIHQSLVNSPHKGQSWRALMFSLICTWTNGWVYNRDTGDLRRHHAHYDVTVMTPIYF